MFAFRNGGTGACIIIFMKKLYPFAQILRTFGMTVKCCLVTLVVYDFHHWRRRLSGPSLALIR